MNITTVGIDLAKDIITVHAQNAQGHCVIARNLRFHEVAECCCNYCWVCGRHGSVQLNHCRGLLIEFGMPIALSVSAFQRGLQACLPNQQLPPGLRRLLAQEISDFVQK